MRTVLLLGVVLSAVAVSHGAPRPSQDTPDERQALRVEARKFARNLSNTIDDVQRRYYRPVSKDDLLEAALEGLYRSVRVAPPATLRKQIRSACNLAEAIRCSTTDNAPPPPGSNDPIEMLIVRLREKLGHCEHLQRHDPLLICCKAMTRVLDPHSGVTTAEEQQRTIGLDQECRGVGLDLSLLVTGKTLLIENVHLGSSAQVAGLRPGDRITHVNGQSVQQAPPATLMLLKTERTLINTPPLVPAVADERLAEPSPLGVQITYVRPGQTKPLQASLLRERYRMETVLGVRREAGNQWCYWVDRKKGLAHIRIAALAKGTAEELRAVIESLGLDLKGLILDFRWCPGGYLNEAVEVAEMFLGEGVIAKVTSRDREEQVYRSAGDGKLRQLPLVVLVNSDTLGGAELIAAALQDHKRATIAGQRTHGKASVQIPLALPIPGVGLKLTNGLFVRPSNRNLHRTPQSLPQDDWGVRPDVDCRLTPALGKKLKQDWLEYSLRPTRSNHRLALDDPQNDPQRQAAVKLLVKMARQMRTAKKNMH